MVADSSSAHPIKDRLTRRSFFCVPAYFRRERKTLTKHIEHARIAKRRSQMSFAVLEKEVRGLPVELQNDIEMYALFVIKQFKEKSVKSEKKRSVPAILDSLTGIISSPVPLTMEDIRAERLSQKYGTET